MKRLSLLLAPILVGNLFAAATLASEPTVSDVIIDEFNFNDVTDTSLDGKLQPDATYTCAGYEQVDPEHGLSLKMNTSSKIRYNFDSSVDGEVTISFDMYANGALSKFWVTSTDVAEAESNGACYLWAGSTDDGPMAWYLNWFGDLYKLGSYTTKKWYNVKLVVSDIRGTTPSVKYYIDEELKITKNLAGDTNGYITFGGGGAADSEVFLDNIKISRPQIHFSEDFTNLTARIDGFSANIESLMPPWNWEGRETDSDNKDPDWYNICKETDDTRGKSLGIGGSAACYYKLPITITEDATLSFEIMTDDISDNAGSFFIKGVGPAGTEWNSDVFAVLRGATLYLGSDQYTHSISANTWYKIDMKFNIVDETTCSVDYYVDGALICEGVTKNIPTHITFKAFERAHKEETGGYEAYYTYIDNIEFSTSAKWFAVTGAQIFDVDNVIPVTGWDKTKKYTIKVNSINTTIETKEAYVAVAGYTNSNRFINCTIVPISVPNSGATNAELEAVDMTGAEKIRIFAFNNHQCMTPVSIDTIELK